MSSSLPQGTDRASRIVWLALGLGLLADLLLRETPWGLNAAIWLSLLALTAIPIVDGAGARFTRVGPLLAGVVFAAGLAWRASPVLLALFGTAYAASISLPLLRDPWREGVLRYPLAIAVTLADAALFALGALVEAARRRPAEGRSPAHAPFLRGALAAVPFLLLFGALFSAADPLFELYVGDVFDRLPSHLLLTLLFGWIAAGVLYGLAVVALPGASDREVGARDHDGRAATEAVVVLALVNALFLLFLVVQLRVLFGGRELVEATLGLSYAEYAREGFFQLVAVSAIALPGLLVGDWLARQDPSSRRRFRGLAGALLLMTTAVLASAALRMQLYVGAYGLTELRIYTSAFMVWLVFVIAWFAVTVLRGRRQRFAPGALVAFVAGIPLLSALNPDVLIVRANAARIADRGNGSGDGQTRPAFDARYVASLSADAVPVLLETAPRLDPWQRCAVAEVLLAGEDRDRAPDWRSWNLSRSRARAAVRAAAPSLRSAFDACPARLRAPNVVAAGDDFVVEWAGFMAPTDHISIARVGAPVGDHLFLRSTWRQPLELSAPTAPGSYEIRYHLGESRRVVGRLPLVVEPAPGAQRPGGSDAAPSGSSPDPTASSHTASSPTRISPSSSTTP